VQKGTTRSPLLYAALIFLAGTSYGFAIPIVRTADAFGINASSIVPLQYWTAFIVFAIVCLVKRPKMPDRKTVGKYLLLGASMSMCSFNYYMSTLLLHGAISVVFMFQFVWMVIVMECIYSRTLPGKRTVAAVVIVLVGTVLAAEVLESSSGPLDPMGVFLGILSGFFYAVFLFASGKMRNEVTTPARMVCILPGGIIMSSIVLPGCYVQVVSNPAVIPVGLALGFMIVLIPLALISFSTPRLSAATSTIMASSELPMGVLFTWAIIGEGPTALGLLGVVLVLLGIVVSQIPLRKPNKGV
jgi:drug/metabolite transporter (DMT)-like permease